MPPKPAVAGFASTLKFLCGWLALAIPIVVTLLRLGSGAEWRLDEATLAGFGAHPTLGHGLLTAALSPAVRLVPFGCTSQRMALLSVVALAIAARLAYGWALRLLNCNAETPRLTPLLALAAALLAALSAPWQLAGTVGGGDAPAALLLLGVTAALRAPSWQGDARRWLVAGVLLGLLTVQNGFAGMVGFGICVLEVALSRRAPSRRVLSSFVVACLLTSAVVGLPWLLRWQYHQRDWSLLELHTGALGLSHATPAWVSDLGWLAVALAAVGLLWGLARERLRRWMTPLLALVLVDLVLSSGVPAAESSALDRLVAVVALSVLAALATQTLAVGIQRMPIPLAEPASVLLVVFHATVVLVVAEQSAFAVEGARQPLTDRWTDEAFASLPPNAVVLLRSQAVARRLAAAQLVREQRPDVLLVPLARVSEARTALQLLAREPKLGPLVREIAIRGRPGEYALSTLADARPLMLELDRSWDRRLLEHLVPHPLWLEFAPHALGRSDRRAALGSERGAFARVAEAVLDPSSPDRATREALAARAQEQALVLATLGDREMLSQVLRDLDELEPEGVFVGEMRKRLEQDARGGIDIAGLGNLEVFPAG